MRMCSICGKDDFTSTEEFNAHECFHWPKDPPAGLELPKKQKLGRPAVPGSNRISRSWRISEKLDRKIMEIAAHAGVDPVDVVRAALEHYTPQAEHFAMLRKDKS